MKAVDFYQIPRAIQDRFVGSVMSGFPPAPLLALRAGTAAKVVWLGVSGASLVSVVVTRLGYGSLESGLALHSLRALALYAGLVFALAYGLLQAAARWIRERALPYASGVYLFPACLIDARDDTFKVYPTEDLSSVDLQGGRVRVAFKGGRAFLFPLAGASSGPALVAEVQAARARALQARAADDPKELVAADPLHNPRFSSPVGPRDPHEVVLAPWKRLGPVAALAVAAIIAPTLWALRNNGSDKTLYARATQANDTAAYRAYLLRGAKFREEVEGTLLPRAELRDAERNGTVEALLAYRAEHPASKIAGEVQAAIRAAMLAELDKAKARGTLAALSDFAVRFPDHGVEPELQGAVHAVYARELDAFRRRAASKDKTSLGFVERLFAWAEKRGGKIEVRFRRKKSESMGRADQFVAKTPSFGGEVSYPSRYFDDKHGARREAALGKTLAARFDAQLSPELFDVVPGAPVPGDSEALPDVKVPTLFITHSADWSGHSYVSQRPRGSYVGVIFPFEAAFVIPADPRPIKVKADIMKHAALGQLKDEDLPPGLAEDKVYEAMATEAFDAFGAKILQAFFATAPKQP
jgi:hypothetical protein